MFARIGYLFIIFATIFFPICYANSLTQQQINLLLENDDIQIFTPSALVKKVTLSVAESSDNSQGKTIIEYDKTGLLINYYQVSVVQDEDSRPRQNTMITTLISTRKDKWQRKQTLGSYEIDKSIYTLKNNKIKITMLPSLSSSEKRIIQQQNQYLKNNQGKIIHFSYINAAKNEQYLIDYHFDKNNLLTFYDYADINQNAYGYTSKIKLKFNYDEQNRLLSCIEDSFYQPVGEQADEIKTITTYRDFDRFGNWLTKVEASNSGEITYKREIEYWDNS